MNSNIMLLSEATDSNATMWIFVALLVVLVVVLLVVPMFTNKKRAKQTMELHNSLQPGDRIKTVGGIIGTIKEIRNVSPSEREMVIETGSGDNKTTMVFDIQALYQVIERVASPVSESVDGTDNADKSETDVLLARNDDVNVVSGDDKEDVADKTENISAEEPKADVAKSEEVAVKDEVAKNAETELAAAVVAEDAVEEKKDEVVSENAVKSSTTTRKPAAKKSVNASPAKKKPVSSTKNSTKK